MAVMGVVQAAVHQIADMVAMGDGLMAAARAMDMPVAVADRLAAVRIGGAHLKHMFVDMVFMGVMQMAVVEIVHMVAVLNGRVAAARAMLVGMVCVFGMVAGHDNPLRVRVGARQRAPLKDLSHTLFP
jgi:hypothetical protein